MNRSGSQAAKNQPDLRDVGGLGQVLPFRRPGQPPLSAPPLRLMDGETERSDILPDDLAQYEHNQDEVVDYRQRALMNVIALVVVAFLVSAGVWLADSIAGMERDQDCMMQGRANCVPIELPIPPPQ
jgi:hypothetical protein